VETKPGVFDTGYNTSPTLNPRRITLGYRHGLSLSVTRLVGRAPSRTLPKCNLPKLGGHRHGLSLTITRPTCVVLESFLGTALPPTQFPFFHFISVQFNEKKFTVFHRSKDHVCSLDRNCEFSKSSHLAFIYDSQIAKVWGNNNPDFL